MVAGVGSITYLSWNSHNTAFLCLDPRPRDPPALPGCVQLTAHRLSDRQQGADCSRRNLRPNRPGLPKHHREAEGTQDKPVQATFQHTFPTLHYSTFHTQSRLKVRHSSEGKN